MSKMRFSVCVCIHVCVCAYACVYVYMCMGTLEGGKGGAMVPLQTTADKDSLAQVLQYQDHNVITEQLLGSHFHFYKVSFYYFIYIYSFIWRGTP